MRKRVADEILEELIENDGCRAGSAGPVSALAIVRLALDLQDARTEVKKLQLELCDADGRP